MKFLVAIGEWVGNNKKLAAIILGAVAALAAVVLTVRHCQAAHEAEQAAIREQGKVEGKIEVRKEIVNAAESAAGDQIDAGLAAEKKVEQMKVEEAQKIEAGKNDSVKKVLHDLEDL